ncbi:uncharacterized protein LOC124460373 isoform X3 [Drosophila willistoni]|uniref:uncharacterized protein LOC124460373 isoform X3 n=1 Tax=Drosophila willistoni TaxID=7260 RepID=UPI001F07AE9E|nr:uncharacterized protein LOC124460373 isoform X3 [Drosophila willistoni]
MLFDTFLYRFELRTGCIILAVLHLLSSLGALENVMHLTAIYFVVVLTERVCEIGMSILLISAAIRSNRYLLKIWMLCLSPVYLFNVSYGCYESLIKYDTLLGFILLIAIYGKESSTGMPPKPPPPPPTFVSQICCGPGADLRPTSDIEDQDDDEDEGKDLWSEGT